MAMRIKDRNQTIKTRYAIMRTKEGLVRTKAGLQKIDNHAKKAVSSAQRGNREEAPETQAVQQTENYVKNNSRRVLQAADTIGRKSVKKTGQNIKLLRHKFKNRKFNTAPTNSTGSNPQTFIRKRLTGANSKQFSASLKTTASSPADKITTKPLQKYIRQRPSANNPAQSNNVSAVAKGNSIGNTRSSSSTNSITNTGPRSVFKEHSMPNSGIDSKIFTVRKETSIRKAAPPKVRTFSRQLKTSQGSMATSKSVKPGRSIKTMTKSFKKTGKTATRSVDSAKKAFKISKLTAKKVAKTLRAAVRMTAKLIKAAIAVTKALITALLAGGWILIVVAILAMVIAFFIQSPFGIFFAGDSKGTGPTLPAVVKEINTEYNEKLSAQQAGGTYDRVQMSGSRAVWKEVIAVYAVKTNTDPEKPQEVATLDDGKVALLKDVFWKMNTISSRIESIKESKLIVIMDENGNAVKKIVEIIKRYLYITGDHKTASDMAAELNFNAEQNKMLTELLDEKNNKMWNSLLYGFGLTPGSPGAGGLIWPLPAEYGTSCITSTFGPRMHPITGQWQDAHGAVDIGAPNGTPIMAAADGIVVLSRSHSSYGFYVKIKHDDTYSTLYAHCSQLLVTEGQSVKQGDIIALVGSTGSSTGNHLHFEVRENDSRIDPMNFF